MLTVTYFVFFHMDTTTSIHAILIILIWQVQLVILSTENALDAGCDLYFMHRWMTTSRKMVWLSDECHTISIGFSIFVNRLAQKSYKIKFVLLMENELKYNLWSLFCLKKSCCLQRKVLSSIAEKNFVAFNGAFLWSLTELILLPITEILLPLTEVLPIAEIFCGL